MPDNNHKPSSRERLSKPPRVLDAEAAARELSVQPEEGLSSEQARENLREFGANRLKEAESVSPWTILLNQFKSIIILVLAGAGAVAFAFGEIPEGITIAVVILVNTGIGFITELRSAKSIEALRQLSEFTTTVRREGDLTTIPAEKVTVGDVLVLEAGDLVPADARLVKKSNLSVDESTLTGESVPVDKSLDSVEEDTSLADRSCMLYRGTALTRGNAEAIVTAVGLQTELGRISEQISGDEEGFTPLEHRLNDLGKKFIWLTVAMALIIVAGGFLAGKELRPLVESALALAVAAIPEGLPIVATIALARGLWRMAKRNALVNRLSAVETLGGSSVICTDKTGTLTENQMSVSRILTPDADMHITQNPDSDRSPFQIEDEPVSLDDNNRLRRIIENGMLCNNAELEDDKDEDAEAHGDPMEAALLAAGGKGGLQRAGLLEEYPEVREYAFDSDTMMMATVHEEGDAYRFAVKGAPEAVLEVCTSDAGSNGGSWDEETVESWKKKARDMAQQGLRVLSFAEKRVDNSDASPFEKLTFLGHVGLLDPPREDVKDVIARCKRSGIRVVMVTGDQPATALAIGQAVGLVDSADAPVIHGRDLGKVDELGDSEKEKLLEANLFARVTPEQKLNLITLHQGAGSVVAMTGDGVNDAPALTRADIGVAMGRRGTQVARDASDIILKDDAFSTIVSAVEEGRIIYANIQKFVVFLLSVSLTMIFVVFLSSMLPMPLAILPLQILFLNAVVHVFPALALGMGKAAGDVMAEPPRDKDEPILSRKRWIAIGVYSMLYTGATLASLLLALHWLGLDKETANAVAFMTLALGQLLHIFNMRTSGPRPLVNEITTNVWIWLAVALCLAINLGALYAPVVSDVLHLRGPTLQGWYVAIAMTLLPLLLVQTVKSFIKAR